MRQYTTVQGDTWDMIAYKVYGNEYHMDKLMEVNTAYLLTAVFSAGVVLRIPDVEAAMPAALPPWRR